VGANLIAVAVFFILFAPFVFLGYSVPALAVLTGGLAGLSAQVLMAVQVATIAMLIIATAVQSRLGVFQSAAYALGAPIGGALIYFGFVSAIVDARKKDAVSWRGRQYTVSEKQSFMR
jgi:hypothetical protein